MVPSSLPRGLRLLAGACALASVLAAGCSSSPPSGGVAVGAPCAKDLDCGGGDQAVCLLAAGAYAGGYCSRFCVQDADCGKGALCDTSTGNGLCVVACATGADCRTSEGYACAGVSGDAGPRACLPSFPAPDAGADTGATDASVDAGVLDAGTDTGVLDAGSDAGVRDARGNDGG